MKTSAISLHSDHFNLRAMEDPSFWILGFVAVGLFMAVSRVAHYRNFHLTLRLDGIFGARQSSKDVYNVNLLEPQFISFYLAYVLLGLWILDFVKEGYEIYQQRTWLILVVIVVYPFAKYMYLQIFASLFDVKEFTRIHFIDFFRIGGLMWLFLFFCLQLCIHMNFPTLDERTVVSLVVIGMALRSLFLFSKLITQSRLSKLHLFFYLCTTEMLPLFFTTKSLSS